MGMAVLGKKWRNGMINNKRKRHDREEEDNMVNERKENKLLMKMESG